MLGDNIKALRKQKGLTQEDLAIKLHIVRQTVSKWEKNLSVPCADLLERIAEILEVDVHSLLGFTLLDSNDTKPTNKTNADIAIQLSKLNEQLAAKTRFIHKIWKIAGITLISVAVLSLMWCLFGKTVSFNETSFDVFTKALS